MMVDKILIVDLIFLVIFCLGVGIFLFNNRKNLKREGLIYFYRTKIGINAIDRFSNKYSLLLKRIKYLVIFVSFLLMVSIIFLLSLNAYAYLNSPKEIIEATNGAPPIAPLIPYFPQIFGLESFFPNFYFSYFIIALAIVAIVHEFAHGVFMKTFKVKIKSTGFIFLGPILGAFVEEDKNTFEKQTNSEQMAILGAGVFANLLFAILFFVSLIIFFNLSYAPAGYIFSGYAETIINTSTIISFVNYSDNLVYVNSNDSRYLVSSEIHSRLIKNETLLDNHLLKVFLDAPAINNNISGIIVGLDKEEILNGQDFSEKISQKEPGQEVRILTIYDGVELSYVLNLSDHPLNSSKGFLGISGLSRQQPRNLVGKLIQKIQYEDPSTNYRARYNPHLADFIRYLLYWIAIINFFVAMFNMLPLGILDGGRFSYLLILSIIKSKSKSEKIYKFILSTVSIIFFLIIIGWIFARFIK
jgi:membrane-associated protease RseP (regulator of RpoE activity)